MLFCLVNILMSTILPTPRMISVYQYQTSRLRRPPNIRSRFKHRTLPLYPVKSAYAAANRALFCSLTQTTARALTINGKYRTGSKTGTVSANGSSHMPTRLLDSHHIHDNWSALFCFFWIPISWFKNSDSIHPPDVMKRKHGYFLWNVVPKSNQTKQANHLSPVSLPDQKKKSAHQWNM